jgi:hypothetical protein
MPVRAVGEPSGSSSNELLLLRRSSAIGRRRGLSGRSTFSRRSCRGVGSSAGGISSGVSRGSGRIGSGVSRLSGRFRGGSGGVRCSGFLLSASSQHERCESGAKSEFHVHESVPRSYSERVETLGKQTSLFGDSLSRPGIL